MKVLVNYADTNYKKAQRKNSATGLKNGFDKVFEWGPEKIPANEKIYAIINNPQNARGNGFWCWKAYIIKESLKTLSMGDFLFYADAGSYFINDIQYLIDAMEKENTDIMTFSTPFIEKQWTKEEVFAAIADTKEIRESNQRLGGFLLLKKTEEIVSFIETYYSLVCNLELINDISEKKNDNTFIENRHDQSVWSVLTKKNGYKSFKDPTEYGRRPQLNRQLNKKVIFSVDCNVLGDYPQVLVLHRSGNCTINSKILNFLRNYAPVEVYLWYYRGCVVVKMLIGKLDAMRSK